MKIIPLTATPAQTLIVVLENQICQIDIYQKFHGLFINLSVAGVLVIGGVVCENLNRIKRSAYLDFIGDLCFVDTQGSEDPDYSGLGDRFVLAYLEEADLAVIGAA